MKAITIHAARDLRIDDQTEYAPSDHQVEIAVSVGGICGSDLHYYRHGGFGAVRLREPMILGHEVSGVVKAVGPNETGIKVGELVAVNPSRPCGRCDFCQKGLHIHCRNMRFYGSAMPFPHIQGAFRERLVVDAAQCFVMAPKTSPLAAALAEPFAVALHAVARAGALIDRRVLVTGSGPIGALVILAARLNGARDIVATDVFDAPLAKAVDMGADRAINIRDEPEAMTDYEQNRGTFDIMFEASGNEKALASGLGTLKPRGILVQIGLGGTMSLPQDQIVAKELEVRGSFRFDDEFGLAAALIGSGRADVEPLVTQEYDFDKAVDAFEIAGDRTRAMKVQLIFAGGAPT
jgi:L-idonate 5-dehydrogenase